MPSDQELVNLFIQKCLEVVPEGTDIRTSLLDYQRAIKFNGNNPELPFTLSQVEHDLTQQENNKKKVQRPATKHEDQIPDQENKQMQLAQNSEEQLDVSSAMVHTRYLNVEKPPRKKREIYGPSIEPNSTKENQPLVSNQPTMLQETIHNSRPTQLQQQQKQQQQTDSQAAAHHKKVPEQHKPTQL